MAEEREKSDLVRIAEILLAHGVEFIVVGGQAETIFGSARVTVDIDLCYRRTRDNLRRLAAALRELKPTLRNAPKDLPFIIDEQTLALGSNFTFDTAFGDLDLLGFLEPLGDYEALSTKAVTVPVAGLDLKVIHIDDLIAIKQYLQRPKDRDSLMHLLAIKKIQSES